MDDVSNIIEVVIFLLLFVGGIIGDIAKKHKAKKQAEEIERAEKKPRQSGGAGIPTQQSAAPKPRQPQPPRRTAAPKPVASKAGMTDDPEWLATLADRKRREAAKAAEIAAAAEREPFETDVSDTLTNRLRGSPTSTFTVSAEQARNGFVMAEILGPPVSMRR